MLRPYTVGTLRRLPCRPLARPPFALRVDVHGGEVAPVVPEDLELTLPLGETLVVDLFGRELAVDPAHHPLGGDALHVAGPWSVCEPVQGVERRVLRGELGGQSDCRTDGQECQDQCGEYLTSLAHAVRPSGSPTVRHIHAVILTHRPMEKLRS